MILSFIPGTVLDIFVNPGQNVKKGDLLLILDAMKMQNKLKCPVDGKIKSIVAGKATRCQREHCLLNWNRKLQGSFPYNHTFQLSGNTPGLS